MAYVCQMTDDELDVWQKKQIDRCRVENAINKLIETYGIIEQSPDSRQYEESSDSIEESAILMAISEHGLHQNSSFRLGVPESGHDLGRFEMCGPSSSRQSSSTAAHDDRHSVAHGYAEANDLATADTSHLLEAAVSVAIQKQGLGLSGLNR